MGFRLDDMIGKYKDFARGYLFYARVTSPAGINQDHPYLVSSTTLPKQTVGVTTAEWQGNVYNFATTQEFETIDIEFRCDTAQQLRTQFLVWTKKIHDPTTNIHGYPGDYFGKVDMTQLDGTGNGVISYTLVNAFPSSIGEIALDYGTKEISKFTVTFTYQYHYTSTPTVNVFEGGRANEVKL